MLEIKWKLLILIIYFLIRFLLNYKKQKEYKKRKRTCRDGINQLGEGMNKKYAEVAEEVGIEDDE
jgi:hypothetical protein